jgi:adenylate cyclase
LRRKYGVNPPGATDAKRLVLVVDADAFDDWSDIETEIESTLPPHLELEVWDRHHVLGLLESSLGVKIDTISQSNILEVREAFTYAKGRLAFGDHWTDDTLQNALLWMFGPWTVKHLCDAGLEARSILPPARYRRVVAMHADLSSFSSFVRDTRDGNVLRRCLTAFYSKARFTILNTGGMLYQFVGDEVVGLYGLPMQSDDYPDRALDAAQALIDIGDSVARDWQRQIDRVQETTGVHVGMAIGDAQIVSQRAFGRAHLGAISDAMNLGSRLVAQARPREIVASNSLYWTLSEPYQERFQELDEIDARNIGRVRAWRMSVKP